MSVVNENSSCYASIKLSGCRIQCHSEIDPNDGIFHQSYLHPLKSFLHFLNTINVSLKDGIIFQFTPNVLEVRLNEFEDFTGIKCSWRSLLQPVPTKNPIYPHLTSFPISISGISSDWFFFLFDSFGSNTKSTLILNAHLNCLKLILPGHNRSEIEIGTFNFSSFKFDESIIVMVSLKEFLALMSLARKMSSLIDLYFGIPGQHPLVAVINSLGSFDCTFVMATVRDSDSIVNNVTKVETEAIASEEEDDHVSETEDEST